MEGRTNGDTTTWTGRVNLFCISFCCICLQLSAKVIRSKSWLWMNYIHTVNSLLFWRTIQHVQGMLPYSGTSSSVPSRSLNGAYPVRQRHHMTPPFTDPVLWFCNHAAATRCQNFRHYIICNWIRRMVQGPGDFYFFCSYILIWSKKVWQRTWSHWPLCVITFTAKIQVYLIPFYALQISWNYSLQGFTALLYKWGRVGPGLGVAESTSW